MKKTFITLIALFTFNILTAQKTTLTGTILNPTTDIIQLTYEVKKYPDPKDQMYYIIENDTITSKLKAGSFVIDLPLEASWKPYNLIYGNEKITLLVEKGDKLHLSANSLLFKESINFTGKGAAKNNFAARIFLAREISYLELQKNKLNGQDNTTLLKHLKIKHDKIISIISDKKKIEEPSLGYLDYLTYQENRLFKIKQKEIKK